MSFADCFEKILPSYLVGSEKSRLKDALSQFSSENQGSSIDYSDFYKRYSHNYFMQSDLIKEIRFANWNDKTFLFEKRYTDAIIISNTCDTSFENSHNINTKQCLFAPLIDFKEYTEDLIKSGYDEKKLENFIKTVKNQLVSNIFYLPHYKSQEKDYIVLLDRLFWFPTQELNSYIENIEENKITSLSLFGHYLFILKLSYHLCRLPEQCDREIPSGFIPVSE